MNGDFSSKLDKILSNPAMMAQIKSLADTMTEAEEAPAPSPEAAPEPAETQSSAPREEELSDHPADAGAPSADGAAGLPFTGSGAGQKPEKYAGTAFGAQAVP